MLFGFFHKSHLLPVSECQYDSSKQFSRSSFQFYSWGALLIVQWSKTIQFRERIVQIPLPVIPCSSLCPVTSILHALSFTSGSPPYFMPLPTLMLSSCVPRFLRTDRFCSSLDSVTILMIMLDIPWGGGGGLLMPFSQESLWS